MKPDPFDDDDDDLNMPMVVFGVVCAVAVLIFGLASYYWRRFPFGATKTWKPWSFVYPAEGTEAHARWVAAETMPNRGPFLTYDTKAQVADVIGAFIPDSR